MKTEKRDIVSFVKSIKSKPGPAGIPSRCSVAGSVTCVCVPENRATGTAFFCIAIIHSFHSIVLHVFGSLNLLGVGKNYPFLLFFGHYFYISLFFNRIKCLFGNCHKCMFDNENHVAWR